MRSKKILIGLLALLLIAVLAAGCGKKKKSQPSTTGKTGGSSITAPSRIASAGKLVFCSDITYPPEEFYEGTKPVGSDIEVGAELAKRMGVKAEFNNTGFDAIIAALLAKKCDVIVSGMNDTPERAKQVDFVDYMSVGQSFMVKKGNPAKVTGIPSLSGKKASVEVGTTNKDFLDAESKKLTAQGKKAIIVIPFPKDTDAANALKTGRVDAYFGDAPVVAYYVAQNPDSFTFGGQPVNPIPVGMAIRKEDKELSAAIAKGVKAMYDDGTMKKILDKWKMGDTALKPDVVAKLVRRR
ncbi:MAG: ABC transporter substrate-binding protein [Actinomycetota bacterium]|nr:ABC transporter substrate-binding protein [Actinomycetota bacterium]